MKRGEVIVLLMDVRRDVGVMAKEIDDARKAARYRRQYHALTAAITNLESWPDDLLGVEMDHRPKSAAWTAKLKKQKWVSR